MTGRTRIVRLSRPQRVVQPHNRVPRLGHGRERRPALRAARAGYRRDHQAVRVPLDPGTPVPPDRMKYV